jgi:peptide-methionine (S)-S-oxide reductase
MISAAATQRAVSAVVPRVRRAVQHRAAHTPFSRGIHRSSVVTKASKEEQDMMDQLLAMLGGGKKDALIAEDKALPGRQQEMKVTNKHFVLGNPIKEPFPDNLETCVFATGCFWGTEKMFWRVPGVYSTSVGYCAGYTQNPTYEEVCSGQTGHTEAVQVAWDPTLISFTDLLAMHWTCHDPTQGMRQGNDAGTQYRSGIYCSTKTQLEQAKKSAEVYGAALKAAGVTTRDITSEMNGPGDNCVYYYAEDYHQQYLAKPGARPYCSAQPTGVPVPDDFLKENGAKLSAGYWKKYGPRPGCTIQVSNEPVPVEEALQA